MQHILTRTFIALIVLIIVAIYYRTEMIPFEYEGFDVHIQSFQKFDAQLDSEVVQAQFGLTRHYDDIVSAIIGLEGVLKDFKDSINPEQDPMIYQRYEELVNLFKNKYSLAEKFKTKNPILLNALQYFSRIMTEILEEQGHLELIESCFDMEYKTQLIDKVNQLFSGILVYTKTPDDPLRNKLIQLSSSIRENLNSSPDPIKNLDLALVYGEVILNLQPQLNLINQDLLTVPILDGLDNLSTAYKVVYDQYMKDGFTYRIILFLLAFILLVVAGWAFTRLDHNILKLNKEVKMRMRAQDDLAKINQELEQRVALRTQELTDKNTDLNKALSDLKDAQEQLILKEKMASVGMLSTGIAHEIKNPLNFINNFSDISVELTNDLEEELKGQKDKIDKEDLSYIQELIEDLKTNCARIHEHGFRANKIVESMLAHSQQSNVKKEWSALIPIIEDNLKLSYSTFKNENSSFEVQIQKDIDTSIGKIMMASQSMSQAILYIFNNAFYALMEKFKENAKNNCTLKVSVQKDQDTITIKIKDSGTGIPQDHLEKIFEPFYTTKPTGMGNTGLGLSICYDTVVKQHKGEISVKSEFGSFTEFTVSLPIGTNEPISED